MGRHRGQGLRPPPDRHRRRHPGRDPQPPGLPHRCGPGLPHARPLRPHPVRWRGPAHPPGRPARLQPAGRLLRAGRTHHRPAPARQPPAAADPGQAAPQGQHPAGRRTRRRDHRPRRSPDRHRSRRRPPGRPDHRQRHPGRSGGQPGQPHRPLSGPSARPARCCPPPRRRRHPRPAPAGRPPAQPEGRLRPHPAQASHRRHRRLRLRQVHLRPRRAAGRPAAQAGRRARQAPPLPGPAGLAGHPARAGSGPDPHRQDPALHPCHLHRLLGRHPPPLRRHQRSPPARLHRLALLLQHRRRPLPRLRRPGRAHHRDELPARRAHPLRHLRRRTFRPRDQPGPPQRQVHRRRAAHDRGRSPGVLHSVALHRPPPATAAGRGSGLPHPGPAEPHPVRRRGPAHQARHRTGQGPRPHRRGRPAA